MCCQPRTIRHVVDMGEVQETPKLFRDNCGPDNLIVHHYHNYYETARTIIRSLSIKYLNGEQHLSDEFIRLDPSDENYTTPQGHTKRFWHP